MPIDKELLEIVACPKCHGIVTLADDESEFRCAACLLAYAVDDGIPNFLIDEAKPLADLKG